jgi:hypothetical protein
MICVHARRWSKFMPALTALCMATLIAGMDARPMRRDAGHWPLLLTSTADTIDPDVAMLQLRANVTLARLIQAGNQPSNGL